MDQHLVILGASGHAKVVLESAREAGIAIAGLIAPGPVGSEFLGCSILGDDNLLLEPQFRNDNRFIVALGDVEKRRRLSLRIIELGATLATVIHPRCVLSPTAKVGPGSVIVAGAVVNADASIGRFCIVNTGATIDHDVVLRDGVQVCPGAHLAGNVHCDEDAFIGTGATVIPNVSVGASAIVGAGAVVIRNVPAKIKVAGNPARPISTPRRQRPDEPTL